MSKRANGEGSIYTDTRGRLVAVVRDPGTGKRRTKVARNMTHAKQLVREMLAATDAGVPIPSGTLTVAALLLDWHERDVKPRRLAPTTAGRYSWIVALLSADPIGRKRVASLTAHDVEDALSRLAAPGRGFRGQGLARDSLVKVRGGLRECLTWAESRGRVARNVANLVKRLPTDARDAAEGRTMTAEQAPASSWGMFRYEMGRTVRTLRHARAPSWRGGRAHVVRRGRRAWHDPHTPHQARRRP